MISIGSMLDGGRKIHGGAFHRDVSSHLRDKAQNQGQNNAQNLGVFRKPGSQNSKAPLGCLSLFHSGIPGSRLGRQHSLPSTEENRPLENPVVSNADFKLYFL